MNILSIATNAVLTQLLPHFLNLENKGMLIS